jgi:Pyridine nucleotide-disulphide oxidoreductase
MSASNDQRHVVIVGGGFAGLGCAQELADDHDVRVTLIDKNNYHQFQPLLYQVATSLLAPSDIAHSLREVFADQDNVDVKLAEISALDTKTKTVKSTDGEEWAADAIVLAAGSQPNFFHTPGADVNSFPLYSLDNATELRSRILGIFEHVDRDPKLVDRGALNFVIVGGGPTGVEVAGAIADTINVTVPAEYRGLDIGEAHIYLLDYGNVLLKAVFQQCPRVCRKGIGGFQRRGAPRQGGQGDSDGPRQALGRLGDPKPVRDLGRWDHGSTGGRQLRPRRGARRASRRQPRPESSRQSRGVRDPRYRQYRRRAR